MNPAVNPKLATRLDISEYNFGVEAFKDDRLSQLPPEEALHVDDEDARENAEEGDLEASVFSVPKVRLLQECTILGRKFGVYATNQGIVARDLNGLSGSFFLGETKEDIPGGIFLLESELKHHVSEIAGYLNTNRPMNIDGINYAVYGDRGGVYALSAFGGPILLGKNDQEIALSIEFMRRKAFRSRREAEA